MRKTYFHNSRKLNENKDKKLNQTLKVDLKRVVDINILLNRVKTEEKNTKKKKIIFVFCTTLALFLFGIVITSIK
tara:strand:+ start:290 stop:514 length:225 start_codon:yes stop_codon:yes gene_type:complete